ncbi:MAG TPA: hypothetical protein IAA40_02890 [Candidatus Olsenella excrementigallinarum]|nr:hypothetical protein [Candidatus Olsenella excrementigallinarum]
MISWKSIPLRQVGPIKLGAAREAVRAAAGPGFEEFRKSPSSENTTDDYGSFHIYYDESDTCVAVEVFPEIEVLVDGEVVFPTTLDKAAAVIPSLERDDDGLLSTEKSIGVYAPYGEMESILFGVRGYYD